MRRKPGQWGSGLLAILFALGLLLQWAAAGARNPCEEPGNLTLNCGFDTFVDHWVGEKRYQIPTAWWYFVLAGNPDFRPADDTYWGAPSVWLLSDGEAFTAGLYQQVQVTPGVVYQTDIGWAAVAQSNFERKLGLDPTGGADPLAPSVVWSRSEWGMGKWPDLTVSARATGSTMTVFVWVHHPSAYGKDWVFLDAVGLWPDPSQPPATLTPTASLTPTRKPPTKTPTPVPPTDTPRASPSPTTTPTATASPSSTATPTGTSTLTVTPTATREPATPTLTPYPTRTPLPTIVPVSKRLADSSTPVLLDTRPLANRNRGSGTEFLYLALGATAACVVLVGVVAGLRIRSRGPDSRD